MASTSAGLRRIVSRDGAERVTYVELFFDLVYVFAVTQLSHLLLGELDARGAFHTLLLLLAVWWAWIYTAWITNWFDPDNRIVRSMLLLCMLVSLVMAAVLPHAFGNRGLAFAGCFVGLQVGRSLFAVTALGSDPPLRRNFQRILTWSIAAGVLWLFGGVVHGSAREIIWLLAVCIEYFGPASGFYVPALGRSTTHDWTISGHHLAERCQAFILIALGESIVVTGATFAEKPMSATVVAALVVAFAGSVALWWLYFDRAADLGGSIIARDRDPGRLGRTAFTYFHLPMVAGIIVGAVGDELAIAHPTGHASMAALLTILAGPALFLAGHFLYKWAVFGRISWPRILAIAVLIIAGPPLRQTTPLAIALVATVIVIAVAAWDTRLAHVPLAELSSEPSRSPR